MVYILLTPKLLRYVLLDPAISAMPVAFMQTMSSLTLNTHTPAYCKNIEIGMTAQQRKSLAVAYPVL